MNEKKYEFKFRSKLANISEEVAKAVLYVETYNINLDIFAFKLILFEALTNAVKHGNKFDENRFVLLSLEYTEENELIIKIKDEGEGFDWQEVISRDMAKVSATSGRGVFLMKTYGYSPSYNSNGNILTMRKEIKNNIRKFLIIEDDFLNRKVLSIILSKYGQCDIAINGEEGLDALNTIIAEEDYYDLICLDIMMPGLDGHETLKEIRKLEKKFKLSPMKILMTTAMGDSKNIMQAFDEQCDGYIVKPIQKKKIIKYLNDFGWDV